MRVTTEMLHPTRFLKRNGYAQRLIQDAVRKHPTGLLTPATFNDLLQKLLTEYRKALMHLPIEARPVNADPLMSIGEDIARLVAFTARGRNIFMLIPELIGLLENTDLGDIRLSDLSLPYEAFYISFGAGLDFGLPGPANVIDGVYVQKISRGPTTSEILEFNVTSRRLGPKTKGSASFILDQELHFYAPLELKPELTLSEALDQAIWSGEIIVEPDLTKLDAMKEAVVALQAEGMPVVSPEITADERDAAFNLEALPKMRDVIGLACNAMCYMSAFPEDGEQDWPSDASRNLVEQARTGSKSARRAATARLLNDGILQVRVIGLPVAKSHDAASGGGQRSVEHHAVSPHWRRGHWRRQPVGEKSKDRKIIWIKPTLVRRDIGEPVVHNVYLVSAPDSTAIDGSK